MMGLDFSAFPTAVVAETKELWLAARHRYVTASEVGALFACNPYKSRKALLKEKSAPWAGEGRSSGPMRAGQFLEEGIVRWWDDDLTTTHLRMSLPPPTTHMCRTANHTSVMVRHPDEACRVAASPDAISRDGYNILVEAKLHGPKSWDGGQPTDLAGDLARKNLPPCPGIDGARCWATLVQYLQVQVQMLVTDIHMACVVRCWGTERRDTYIPACPALHAMIETRVGEFWAEVARGG